MQIFRHFTFILSIGFIAMSCLRSSPEVFEIRSEWQFKHADSSAWITAVVPGCAHLDLLTLGIIPDPFDGNNEKNLQWIGESDWEYRVNFNADHLLLKDEIELVFKGLDTYADVYLNDSLVITANNMFRTWRKGIKNILKPGQNAIFIHFHAPERIELEKASEMPYQLPDKRGFTRKAPYQYGWDWGPKLVTTGIWKPVYIEAWEIAKIENVQLALESLDDSLAIYTANLDALASIDATASIGIHVNGKKLPIHQDKFKLKKGLNSLQVEFKISDPDLWWPAGSGAQPLYAIDFELITPRSYDKVTLRIGIREIELVREDDSIGQSFYFRVNGQPLFMKGANYIPQDNFPTRVTEKKYRQTLQSVVDANMNMLRIWGGGIYEEDLFYDLCDELGILVWQDFMFACNMYPGDSGFVRNVEQEAVQQVKRLGNHPSMALWCGNNEVDEGWHNWGWQEALGYSETDSAEVWDNYKKVFHEVLPGVVSDYFPDQPYVSSSPRIGWGHDEALYEGDMHYWGVWWGEEPFEIYEGKVGRFMSEFGFQGFPDISTIRSFTDQPLSVDDANLINHQKHPRGMELIQTYMERDFPVPTDFEDYVYVSQLVQAYGLKKALEAHRRARPGCMGTLYWQLNDCWPAISWSSIDYNNRWKALHYESRRIFRDYLISFEQDSDSIAVFVVSDKTSPTEADLELTLLDFSGNILLEESLSCEIPPGSSSIYCQKRFMGFDKSSHLLKAALKSDGELLAENVYYFVTPKNLKLQKAEISKEIQTTAEGILIKLESPILAKNVSLRFDEDGFFSDNYFDLLPGETRSILFKPADKNKEFSGQLTILQLAEVRGQGK